MPDPKPTCATCEHWLQWMASHGDCLLRKNRETDADDTCAQHKPKELPDNG